MSNFPLAVICRSWLDTAYRYIPPAAIFHSLLYAALCYLPLYYKIIAAESANRCILLATNISVAHAEFTICDRYRIYQSSSSMSTNQ